MRNLLNAIMFFCRLSFVIALWITFNLSNAYSKSFLIKDVNIIPMNENKLLKKKSVLIIDGKIVQIAKYKKIKKPQDAEIISGKNKYLMPGLADMHVHLPTLNQTDTFLLWNLAAGITHIRVMNSNFPQSELMNKLNSHPETLSPKIHYSRLIKRNEIYSETSADSLMLAVKENKFDFIKLYSLSNESTFDNIMHAANKYGITVCGHYPTFALNGKPTEVNMEKVVKSGFRSIEHLAGYTNIKDNDSLDYFIKLSQKQGMYNCPTLDWDIMSYDLMYPTQYKDRITYKKLHHSIIDNWKKQYAAEIVKAGGGQKIVEVANSYQHTFKHKQEILRKMYEQKCMLLIGSDASNLFQCAGFNIYEEMMNWKDVGIDNFTILQAATINTARFFNEESKWGTIEEGKQADVIILSKNPLADIKNIYSVNMTIIGNRLLKNKELLNKLICE